mmetsp:Transcript_24409/g.60128  ORF Transcript_24409/g.60128 Transcript_24409/m.60128 type:complete len:204 (-) Transcript_24409:34-645(-)|eukprot:CAMPEP_0206229850 /NCGR_PEP_ID=MMETSP0047_2-20121206/9924_1 /ASSEMBLY_ACC=CAM_ASM_000192 /TAXON_ID=195065 /ORGANISM="Chroomonas mesostigmatica_cf, Strain CCMP1168" /LENGTH=203 /DNA_ID=CAMNT_0053653191 /DNA_START=69 /DNA_END=680 /DNA_ORIENTATION=+
MRRITLSTLALGVLVLAACLPLALADDSGEDRAPPATAPEPEGDEHIVDVVQDTFNDIYETTTKSEAPITDLKKKYAESIKKLVMGSAIGYAGGAVVKYLSVSLIKAAAVGAIGFVIALATGVIGRDTSELAKQVDEILEGMNKLDTKNAEKIVSKKLDLNKDGKVDGKDFKEIFLRAERALMKNNLPLSFGGIIGVCAGLYQ